LSVQVFGDPKIVNMIPASSFYPPPKVDSAVVRIDMLDKPRIPQPDLHTFFHLAKTAFAQKRKKLRNSLASLSEPGSIQADTLLEMAGIDPNRRPETLSLDEWRSLVYVYRETIPSREPSAPAEKKQPT
jgi:16S rRNA (adenine1518-N6/adenine1519-N6)-dimethyltransferase